jgi:hypothetical protein
MSLLVELSQETVADMARASERALLRRGPPYCEMAGKVANDHTLNTLYSVTPTMPAPVPSLPAAGEVTVTAPSTAVVSEANDDQPGFSSTALPRAKRAKNATPAAAAADTDATPARTSAKSASGTHARTTKRADEADDDDDDDDAPFERSAPRVIAAKRTRGSATPHTRPTAVTAAAVAAGVAVGAPRARALGMQPVSGAESSTRTNAQASRASAQAAARWRSIYIRPPTQVRRKCPTASVSSDTTSAAAAAQCAEQTSDDASRTRTARTSAAAKRARTHPQAGCRRDDGGICASSVIESTTTDEGDDDEGDDDDDDDDDDDSDDSDDSDDGSASDTRRARSAVSARRMLTPASAMLCTLLDRRCALPQRTSGCAEASVVAC